MLPLLHSASVESARPAILDSSTGRWWTYGELQQRVASLAKSLQYPRKALAFCLCRNDVASVAWYLASLEAGHAVALLDEGLAKDFRARLISSYAPDFILASAATPSHASADELSGYEALATCDPSNLGWRRSEVSDDHIHQDLAVLLSTSGSTGSPRFVRLTGKNVRSNADSICQALEIRAEDRAISSLPFHYSYGLSVLNTHLLAGATIVMTNEALTSPSFWNTFRESQCTSFAGVPYSYQILRRIGLDQMTLPSLRVMTQAGGKLHNDLIAHFHKFMLGHGGRFFVMYGQTEATARISVLPPPCLPEKLGSAGLAIPGGSLAVQMDGNLTTQAGQSGELVYSGPNVMLGYATGREDLALGDTLGGRLLTGDSAHFDQDGYVFIEGRMKRDAKVFGLRINLDEIEDMLRPHGPTAVVAGKENLVIFCEYGDEAAFVRYRQELATKLRLHQSAFKFLRIDRIPTTATGKINYPELAARP